MAHKINLTENERVVCAYAQKANLLGLSNCTMFVIIGDKRTGVMREVRIHPDQLSDEMLAVFDIASAVHETLTELVEIMVIVNARKDG